jgi:ribosomal protein S18 acetylase RimI-like enzyme
MNDIGLSSYVRGRRHPYTLRPATDADYDFLYQLHVAAIRPAVETTWGWDDAFQQTYFRSRWNPTENQIVMVAGQRVGTLRLVENQDEIFLALIEIHPDYQNRGLGSTIIQDLLAEAHQRSVPVLLHVLKANEDARRLYERLGFKIIEERKERYVMKKAQT